MINKARALDRRATRHERRETLLTRLAEAEETLRAIRGGEVDGLVVRGLGGDQVYTLHGAEEPYRKLVEEMRDGAILVTPSGDILYSNARFAALVGAPLESVLGGRIGHFVTDANQADVATLLNSGSGTCQSCLRRADGSTVEVFVSLTTTEPEAGTLSLIVTDLSELLEARGDRDRAARESHLKDEFLAMLSHELRNPIGAIRSAVGVLESVDLANGPARARAVIARQVGHLAHLVEDLLDVERVASGKIRLDRHPLDMAEALRHAAASVTANEGLDRNFEIATEPTWVDGDAVRLEQVFANIMTNAVKYTPPGGGIRVSVRGDGDDAVLSVEDTGFGIAPDLLPSVFDLFVQGERTLDRAQGGLGIGLSLVRRLVELHGGTVNASSGGLGQGSTFTVRLPRVRGPHAETGVPSSFDRTAPKRVLIIEDSPDAREMFHMMLELAGHSVYEAENGERGLELLERENPDVAIIDIGLPGLSGFEVARRIRERPSGRAMLLLALTGYGSASDVERSAKAGFDYHIVKPVDIDELARLISGRTAISVATPS